MPIPVNAIKLETLSESEQRLLKEIELQREAIDQSEKMLLDKKKEKEAVSSHINSIRTNIDQLEKSVSSLKDQQHDINIRENNLSFERESIAQRIRQIYKVNLDEANPDIHDISDWSQIQSRIEELTAKVERIGTVNLVAIEEHNELKDRLEFMNGQYEDLVHAKES